MDLFLSKGLFSVLHPITYFLSFAPHIPNCAWKSCNQGNEHSCNLRTGYCFSFHGPDNKVRWSLALEQAWRPIFFFCIILVCNFSPLLLRRRKISSKGKKKKLKACTQPIAWACKLWHWREQLEEQFESMSSKCEAISHKLYIELFNMLET